MGWVEWPWERVSLLFVGLAFGMITIQVALMHLGGAFHKWQMWIPVIYGPVLMIVGFLLTSSLTPLSGKTGIVLFGIGLLGGLGGTYYHLHAIGEYIMGYRLRNFIAGPPPVLPAVFAALSGFGLLAIVWKLYVR